MTAYLHFQVSTQMVELCQVVSVHGMKAYRGKGGRNIAPLILILGTKWGWFVNFMPRPLNPRE